MMGNSIYRHINANGDNAYSKIRPIVNTKLWMKCFTFLVTGISFTAIGKIHARVHSRVRLKIEAN